MTTSHEGDPARGPFEVAHGGLVHAALEASVVVDESQRIVMINPAAQRMFGCTARDALGKDLSLSIPPQHRKTHATHVREFDVSGVAERPES